MAIDPRLYTKYSGRTGDPYTRLGEALAQNVKAQHARDEMPKGLSGGMKVVRQPGIFANIIHAIRDMMRAKDR